MSMPSLSLEDARAALSGVSTWVLTDGKAGDRVQCLGVAERLNLMIEERVIKPRPLFAALMPWGPIDPREAPTRAGSPIAPEFPDLVIASGRRAAPYLRAIKRASQGKTFTVFLKDPRSGANTADFLWVPAHDRLRGRNVMTTLTSPHRLSPELLVEARAKPATFGDEPFTALLMGGNAKDMRFTPEDEARLLSTLETLLNTGARVHGTPSRRTPPALAAKLGAMIRASGGFFWDGVGENPYLSLLTRAEAFIVTAESVNMLGEAVSTGKPVFVFHPTGGARKIARFLDALFEKGAIQPFDGGLEAFTYEPIDATPLIATELARRFIERRSRP